jgi:hypothetical protein
VAFAGESPYNPNQSSPRYLYCTLEEVGPAHKVYYSAIFLANPKNFYPIQNSFLHFVAEKYSYKIQPGVDEYHMPVQCHGSQSSEVGTSQKESEVQREKTNGINVIETAWTFGSQKTAETAPPSSASTSPSPLAAAPQDDKLDAFTMATLQQDPRAARLSPLDRQFVLSEAPKAKSYCAKDTHLSQALDCNCFVRTVFNYRIAHAAGPIQTTNFPPLATVLEKPDFSCSECVDKSRDHAAVACDRRSNPQ